MRMLLTFFTKTKIEKTPYAVHYNEDSSTAFLFQALATATIDLMQKNENSGTQFEFLLNQHALYYPKQLPKHVSHLATLEQCEYLLIYNQPHKEVLIPSMAYTLQQIAIDIMCQHPELYGNLLLEGHRINELRKDQKIDDSGLLQALADHGLHTNIYIERVSSPYELPVRECYTTEVALTSPIHIHFKENVYQCERIFVGGSHEHY